MRQHVVSEALPAREPEHDITEMALTRALNFLRTQQRASNHWVGTLSSSALATAMVIVALQLVKRGTYQDRIMAGRRWLVATQHEDGGWGDGIIDESNINATSLALGALIFTQPAEPEPEARECMRRARACLDAFGGWEAVGDPNRCTLSGPCRTVAALAGIFDWRHIKRLRPEVILLPQGVRRTISTTFPAYLSIATLHAESAPHPLNALPSYDRVKRLCMEWLAQTQGANGSF
ncbi:MAG: hypothetical protein ACRDHP_00610 [Ktedonobacterales bacterium]